MFPIGSSHPKFFKHVIAFQVGDTIPCPVYYILIYNVEPTNDIYICHDIWHYFLRKVVPVNITLNTERKYVTC